MWGATHSDAGDMSAIVPGKAAGVRVLIVTGLTAVYALCFVAIKAGLSFAPPLLFAGLRTLIAGLSLLGLLIGLRRSIIPTRAAWPWIVPLALTATAFAYGAMFVAPGRAGAGITSVLGNAQPLFVAALAAIALGERMTPGKWVTLGLGLTGVGVMAAPAMLTGDVFGLSGAVLALASAGGFAAGSVLIKRMDPGPDLLPVTAWQLILGSLVLLAASGIAERGGRVIWSGEFLSLLIFLAVPGTAVATAAWYWLVQGADVGRLAMFFFLVPVFGLALAAVTYGERIDPFQAAGAMFILTGSGVAVAESRQMIGQLSGWMAWRLNHGPKE